MIEGYAAGKYRLSAETLAERNRKISEANKGRKQSWEQRRRHSQAMTGRHWSDDVVESRAAPMRGRPQKAEATKAGPTNVNSLQGALRDACAESDDPNLTDFVQTHPDLFGASDLIPESKRKAVTELQRIEASAVTVRTRAHNARNMEGLDGGIKRNWAKTCSPGTCKRRSRLTPELSHARRITKYYEQNQTSEAKTVMTGRDKGRCLQRLVRRSFPTCDAIWSERGQSTSP